MHVAKQDLDEWRAFCTRLTTALCAAEAALAAGSIAQTRELLWSAQDASARMGMKLELAGANKPDSERPQAEETAAKQWYALMLRDAWEAARQMEAGESEQPGAARVLRLLLREVEDELYPA